ncbi:acyltransferase [Prevotella sp. A2931]|uniref:Acyltransferase n=1 Tax=Prevotella illustrans TaxID=2800387 RepID=A0ABS3M8F6_9BACT|nr:MULTISPECIES: acyltransferase [Prevotella]MBO1364478.1 acyltransferase [Prevotella illustrans]PTL27011.1 acyltransferase [Prevotella sp. oral taxon 820]
MRIKDIELSNISRYRGELMGAAMLFIILFHVGLPRDDLFFGLRRMGNIGVDIFLFLSGIGLWFSWAKNDVREDGSESARQSFSRKYRGFLKRRFLRIYPAWLLMASLYYIPRFHPTTPMSWLDLVGDITVNWDFWLHDELTFWYIPAIMMLYLWSPLYMELIRRHPIYRWLPVVMVMWCILVQWVTPIHNLVGHIEIFWSRVPIFFIGVNMGEMTRQKKTIDGTGIWMILLMFSMALAASIFLEQTKHGQFPLFIERMLYIPLTVTTILMLNRMFRRTPGWFNATFRFFGGLSLEAYLIHSHFVLDYLPSQWSYWPTFLVCVICTMPPAWLLHRLATFVADRITTHG